MKAMKTIKTMKEIEGMKGMKAMKTMKVMKKIPKKQHMQLTAEEQNLVVRTMGAYKKGKAKAAAAAVNTLRRQHRLPLITPNAVYRFARGDTHKRGATEKRGRHVLLSKLSKLRLMQARRRLIKEADGEQRVTYKDIMKEANVPEDPSQKIVEECLREKGVKYVHPREKFCITEGDAKIRNSTCVDWGEFPESFWVEKVHG